MSHLTQLSADRRFRKLFIARTISNLGNGIAPIALAFGVLALPNTDATTLSIVLAAQAIPLVLVLPVGGVVADRLGRARVIAYTDLVLSAVIAVMAFLFISGSVMIPALVFLSFIVGCLNGLWWPAYSGLTPDVVADDLLQPANAYLSVASNVGLIAGSALGGLLVAAAGAGVAIAVDSVTFLIAGIMVFTFRKVSKPHNSGQGMFGDLAHGWRVFLSFRWVVVVVLSFSTIVMALYGAEHVMGPVLAIDEYGGAAGWAVVLAFQSAGLLLGGFASSRINIRRPMLFGMLVTLTLPLWLISLAFAAPLWVVSLGSFAWGVSIEFFQVLWYTALQTNVPREALSRVSSYEAMGSLMFGPIGLALAGPLVALVGLRTSFLICAAVATIAILLTLLSKSVRSLTSSRSEATA
ncbi:MAG: MFS transporter [Actinomycetota bacterium]|nr:MFS transporter [Actinomycetota bacterium]